MLYPATAPEPQPHQFTPTHIHNTKLTHSHKPVEEDAADIIVANGRFFRASSHAEWPKEAVYQNGQLVDILSLSLHHVKYNLVSLPHALSMRRADVVLNNDLPLPSTEPASHETLDLDKR